MKSKNIALWLSAAVVAIGLIYVVPRLRIHWVAQGAAEPDPWSTRTGGSPWIPTWKNTYPEPTNGNHRDEVCIADAKPCLTPPAGTPDYVVHAVAHWVRFPQDVWEDATAKPWQALTYIGAKPGDRVVDIISMPGDKIISMYWGRLFYHLVGDNGRVFPFFPSVGCRQAHIIACQEERNFGSSTKGYGIRPWYTLLGDPRWSGLDEALDMEHTMAFRNLYPELAVGSQFPIPESADVVFSMGVWHQFHNQTYDLDMGDFLPRVFEEINNGGSLVIADYAGKPGTGFTQTDSLNRVDKEAVKAEVLKYGFVFDSESDIWAKKDDDHTRKVPEASMPGVADMFILKFKKPMNAPPNHRETREQMAGWLDANYNTGGDLTHPKPLGGGTWFNYDYTVTEFQGSRDGGAQGMIDSWFNSATGEICQRQEYSPITKGILGCHYDWETLSKWHTLGDRWEERTDFCTEEFSYSGCGQKNLSPMHTWARRPDGCTLATLDNPTNECRDYFSDDNLFYSHMAN